MNYGILSRFKGVKGFLSIILPDENEPPYQHQYKLFIPPTDLLLLTPISPDDF